MSIYRRAGANRRAGASQGRAGASQGRAAGEPSESSAIDKTDELDKLIEQHVEQHFKQNGSSLHGKLWRGHKAGNFTQANKQRQRSVLSTGYAALDAQLHNGGWPLTTTTELGLSQAGIGELRLLLPALRALLANQQTQGNIVWIAPPFLPFAPALLKEQIDISRLTIVQPNNMQDTLWAAEQALLAECCAAVLTWTGNYNLNIRELRRLQLAAEKTHTWNILLRHSDCLKQASASGLRMQLDSNSYNQLAVHILKQPQSFGGQYCTLSLHPHYENWQRLPAHLLPHQNRHQQPELPMSLNDSSGAEHHHATVAVLTSLSALQTVH